VITLTCVNFNEPLGTGTSQPIELAEAGGKKLFVSFWAYAPRQRHCPKSGLYILYRKVNTNVKMTWGISLSVYKRHSRYRGCGVLYWQRKNILVYIRSGGVYSFEKGDSILANGRIYFHGGGGNAAAFSL
jgi:hypothetical protein